MALSIVYSIDAVSKCEKINIASMKHSAETFPLFYPAVCAVAMNFNSSIILCLSSIDICPPIEFHSLDLFCALSFSELHVNFTEQFVILMAYSTQLAVRKLTKKLVERI